MADSDENIAIKKLIEFKINENDFEELTEPLRTLRNYCASGRHAQLFVASYPTVLLATKNIALHLLETEKSDLCLLLCLQFVANYLVDNKTNQQRVWEEFSEVVLKSLRYKEPKIQNCSAMILYNVLLDNEQLLTATDYLDNILDLTQCEITAEYAVFILELFICKSKYVEENFRQLSSERKIVLLHICESIIKSGDGRKFPDGMALFLSKYFMEKSNSVLLAAGSDIPGSDAVQVALILEVINSMAGLETSYLKEIQSNIELLDHVVVLLKTVHTISKEKGNNFSMLLKISDLEDVESNESIQQHPAFGFKASLVRLIGNMCWRNRQYQDRVRELEAIPLILDCCNIDARNPLIIQWAVLAMRNICENNLENQRVVACVDRTGQVSTARLAERGFSMNLNGN